MLGVESATLQLSPALPTAAMDACDSSLSRDGWAPELMRCALCSGPEASTSSGIAQATFALNNGIEEVDEVFRYDKAAQQAILQAAPWKADPHYFKKVRISAVALIKMVRARLRRPARAKGARVGSEGSSREAHSQVMHARSGGAYEIMGLMQGKLEGDTMVVMDAFALPVVGTETRVNAQNEANEFMIQYIECSPAVRTLLERSRRKLGAVRSLTHGDSGHRSDAWRTSLVGTTPTRATAAGSPESTLRPKGRTKRSKTPSSPSSCVLPPPPSRDSPPTKP